MHDENRADLVGGEVGDVMVNVVGCWFWEGSEDGNGRGCKHCRLRQEEEEMQNDRSRLKILEARFMGYRGLAILLRFDYSYCLSNIRRWRRLAYRE